MNTKTITNGYMYVSSNGQVVIDRHPNDEAHLLSGPTSDVQPLHDCRVYLSDVVPADWLNKAGMFIIEHTTNDKFDTLSVELSFIPDPGSNHYAGHLCKTCGSADLEPNAIGCMIFGYKCRTCEADPAIAMTLSSTMK